MTTTSKIDAAVSTAVAAIESAAQAVGDHDSGINSAQIEHLRSAIDGLEDKLNERKRDLNAAGADKHGALGRPGL